MANTNNPLATGDITKLIVKYALPSIVSGLVGALYNITDQIFIGWSIGELGMGATNVAFPFSTICMSLALLFGVGGAANMSLSLGKGDKENARSFAANSILLLFFSGVVISIISLIFLKPMLQAFGATEAIMPYSITYVSITALGFPFFILSIGLGHLIRADGSPTYSMLCVLSGAVFNLIGTPLFLFVFKMGMEGVALSTVLGQAMSSGLGIFYVIRKSKVIKMSKTYLSVKLKIAVAIAGLGMAACVNQLAITLVQISMNNLLTTHGENTVYGSDLPLAVVGAASKIFTIFLVIVLGIAQGCQPLIGFNYGAKNFDRVRQTYKKAALAVFLFGTVFLACFQLMPNIILSMFGSEEDLFYELGERFLRISYACLPIIAVQIVTTNFFTAIGKSIKGIIMSLTRQVLFLIPLLFIFSHFIGFDGILYAGPIADTAAFILAMYLIQREFKKLKAGSNSVIR